MFWITSQGTFLTVDQLTECVIDSTGIKFLKIKNDVHLKVISNLITFSTFLSLFTVFQLIECVIRYRYTISQDEEQCAPKSNFHFN